MTNTINQCFFTLENPVAKLLSAHSPIYYLSISFLPVSSLLLPLFFPPIFLPPSLLAFFPSFFFSIVLSNSPTTYSSTHPIHPLSSIHLSQLTHQPSTYLLSIYFLTWIHLTFISSPHPQMFSTLCHPIPKAKNHSSDS